MAPNPTDPLWPTRTPAGPRAARYTAAFYTWIGYAPDNHAKTREVADAYHRRILAVLNDPTTYPVTHSERFRLQRMEKRWKKRVTGADPRWARYGSTPGRRPKDEEAELRPAPHPAWRD